MAKIGTKETLHDEGLLKKFRVQLDFTPRDFERINNLVEELGLGTRAELFRDAILLLEWMISKRKSGQTVTATARDGRCIEPEFSFLRNVSFQAPQVSAQVFGATHDFRKDKMMTEQIGRDREGSGPRGLESKFRDRNQKASIKMVTSS